MNYYVISKTNKNTKQYFSSILGNDVIWSVNFSGAHIFSDKNTADNVCRYFIHEYSEIVTINISSESEIDTTVKYGLMSKVGAFKKRRYYAGYKGFEPHKNIIWSFDIAACVLFDTVEEVEEIRSSINNNTECYIIKINMATEIVDVSDMKGD